MTPSLEEWLCRAFDRACRGESSPIAPREFFWLLVVVVFALGLLWKEHLKITIEEYTVKYFAEYIPDIKEGKFNVSDTNSYIRCGGKVSKISVAPTSYARYHTYTKVICLNGKFFQSFEDTYKSPYEFYVPVGASH